MAADVHEIHLRFVEDEMIVDGGDGQSVRKGGACNYERRISDARCLYVFPSWKAHTHFEFQMVQSVELFHILNFK